MPIFDYRCTQCNTIYDVLHKGKELTEDIVCPQCGSNRHTKLMSVPHITTKGAASVQCDQRMCETAPSCCGDRCSIGRSSG